MKKILVVEDEAIIRSALRRLLERNGFQVSEAGSVREAIGQLQSTSFHLVISDLRLPGQPGTDLIKLAGEVPVLIMTSFASLQSAVDSMKMGAVDYIPKPFDHDQMIESVRRIVSQFEKEQQDSPTPSAPDSHEDPIPGILGNSHPLKKVFSYIRKSAPTRCNVLIQGETGTGKELVAKAIHQLSPRAGNPLICVNCAAIPHSLIESELFGYEKGAFTGALTSRVGLIEAANGGSFFLDEIGELPLEAQARLLRFLQEGEIRKIGSVESQKIDVRVIAATHRDLKTLSREGAFRQDLFYRLDVMHIALPPLRERGKDILELAEAFLSRFCEKIGKPPKRFSPEAIQAITSYSWPGNIREMENVIERAVILSDGDYIDNEFLNIDLELVPVGEQSNRVTSPPATTSDMSMNNYFERFVRENQHQLSETELAKRLGISRKCLWERRIRLGIPRTG
jgi:two-component system response regulator HydG